MFCLCYTYIHSVNNYSVYMCTHTHTSFVLEFQLEKYAGIMHVEYRVRSCQLALNCANREIERGISGVIVVRLSVKS